jgi:hypothetical protein
LKKEFSQLKVQSFISETTFKRINEIKSISEDDFNKAVDLIDKIIPKSYNISYKTNGLLDWNKFKYNLGKKLFNLYKKQLGFYKIMLIKNAGNDLIIHNVGDFDELLKYVNKYNISFNDNEPYLWFNFNL